MNNIIEIHTDINAPKIGTVLAERIKDIENINECILGIQLSYHENSTLFYLNKICCINFDEYYIEIRQTNNSSCYLDYNEILEYFIVHNEDLFDRDYL